LIQILATPITSQVNLPSVFSLRQKTSHLTKSIYIKKSITNNLNFVVKTTIEVFMIIRLGVSKKKKKKTEQNN